MYKVSFPLYIILTKAANFVASFTYIFLFLRVSKEWAKTFEKQQKKAKKQPHLATLPKKPIQ